MNTRLCDDGAVREVVWSGDGSLTREVPGLGGAARQCMNTTSEAELVDGRHGAHHSRRRKAVASGYTRGQNPASRAWVGHSDKSPQAVRS
jgi:hypothetical protein